MKQICLFTILFLVICIAGNAQLIYKTNLTAAKIDSLKMYPLHLIPDHYYNSTLGFFCKKELQFEKATKIPLKFRLGSIDYTDYLEQKPNAIRKP